MTSAAFGGVGAKPHHVPLASSASTAVDSPRQASAALASCCGSPRHRRPRARSKPRPTVARRVLVSFGITVIAFAFTLSWGIVAQRRAADDSVEIARGYVPVAMRLAQLRAAQSTLSTLVDGIPDEREPASTRALLDPRGGARRTLFVVPRAATAQALPAVGSGATQQLARRLAAELDGVETLLDADRALLERLYAAIASGDRDGINRVLVPLGALEHDADRRLRLLAGRVSASIDALSIEARDRELRSIWALVVLAALTLAVGAVVSLHVRRLLAPLARVTDRARAVAAGDLTAREVAASDDERSASSPRRSRRWSPRCRGRRRRLSRTSASPPSGTWRPT